MQTNKNDCWIRCASIDLKSPLLWPKTCEKQESSISDWYHFSKRPNFLVIDLIKHLTPYPDTKRFLFFPNSHHELDGIVSSFLKILEFYSKQCFLLKICICHEQFMSEPHFYCWSVNPCKSSMYILWTV